jgi:hypothetical protein
LNDWLVLVLLSFHGSYHSRIPMSFVHRLFSLSICGKSLWQTELLGPSKVLSSTRLLLLGSHVFNQFDSRLDISLIVIVISLAGWLSLFLCLFLIRMKMKKKLSKTRIFVDHLPPPELK